MQEVDQKMLFAYVTCLACSRIPVHLWCPEFHWSQTRFNSLNQDRLPDVLASDCTSLHSYPQQPETGNSSYVTPLARKQRVWPDPLVYAFASDSCRQWRWWEQQ
jgi:hypothetical protein